ncbi:sugar ABC transporter permease [Pseudoclavibacter sp. RFBJ3]|uniref:carbohydrate ABC transporter permease n=1 Tax=unclassified Pseudoclavibacter TaxID=2615177 RepID=UPI000CE7200A|nr:MULTISPECIES: sugar ABC transporter permease [unclassified Pseudoclavibacter]PPF37028.1 sugar ABC transporter permease [Pseudoclavibacter sp. AY1H1]PPF87217.1 sugar ABC transporter permease [Pseudoclavibacter sp. RFBJ5]PPF89440.1 sugar ABC transporter permease [Pseudoclavibacter sp. RFBJ3]PPG00755.1 sugar ABC transporter permease [Pseudoclavibacter sp. RFBH5]PPG18863.1 sugar ABC transporter permease [Pseudoclavibacter sp. RFBI4]
MTLLKRVHPRAPRRTGVSGTGGRTAAIFLVPFFALFLVTMIAPVVYAIGMSLFAESRSGLGFGETTTEFVGLGNYISVLSDQSFIEGFGRLAIYCVLYVPVLLLVALTLALLLDAGVTYAKRTFQLLLFLPHAVPGVIAALIWAYLYTPGVSPIVKALASGGIEINFLSVELVLPSMVNIAVWEWAGYNVIILFTALQAVSREVLEAARIDGAGGIRTAISIKTPLIAPALGVALLFTVIGSLQLFTEPRILSSATTAVTSTWVPNMWAYDAAFNRNNLPEAAAASIVLAALAGVLSWAVTRFTSKEPTS